MKILQQYRDSLKATEAEEVFDLLIYRPVAILFVKATYPTNLTPNQVSSIAMLFGVIAGILFGFGTYTYLIAGGIFYFTCNVLDCVDGQIARLKKNGTKTGRIIDGFIDYIVSISVFIGIGIGLTYVLSMGVYPEFGSSILHINGHGSGVLYIWIITVLAGVSSALQAFYFDLYRNKYLENVYGKFSRLEDEITEFGEERERVRKQSGGSLDKFLIAVYLGYCRLQIRFQSRGKSASSGQETADMNVGLQAKEYSDKNRLLLRFWSFAGSTTHITVCILCAFIDKLELFLLICIVPLNVLVIILYVMQKARN